MQIYSIWFKYTLKEMLIIGIAGGTGSGKTTVVRKIVESLPAGEVVLLPQDSYYKDSSHVPVEERQNINFDHPDAFEWSLLSKHVMMLKEGKSIEQPTYSYLTCTRQPETIHIEPREVVIIEGILALCDKKLRNIMDLKIFVDADPDERLIRVIQRDVIERGRTAEAVMERYTRVLKPMHLQFIEPCKRYADRLIRLHAKKCDQHRTDHCRRTHSCKSGSESSSHPREKCYDNH